MERTKAKYFHSLFANSRPAFAVITLVIITSVLGYIVGTSYANSDDRMILPNKSSRSSGEQDIGKWLTVRMRVTAYCPCPKCCGSYSDGVTACGHKISQGEHFVAADKIYPFGTKMIIPGYKNGEAVKVLDRGGVICGDRLDVFFGTHQEALEWGVRDLDVKVCRK